jgi:hypothetical protein
MAPLTLFFPRLGMRWPEIYSISCRCCNENRGAEAALPVSATRLRRSPCVNASRPTDIEGVVLGPSFPALRNDRIRLGGQDLEITS